MEPRAILHGEQLSQVEANRKPRAPGGCAPGSVASSGASASVLGGAVPASASASAAVASAVGASDSMGLVVPSQDPQGRRLANSIYFLGLRFGRAYFGHELPANMVENYRKANIAQENRALYARVFGTRGNGRIHNPNVAVLAVSALCFHDLD